MKRRFEYQPGLFGLASVAAGCAAKDGKVRTKEGSASAGGEDQIKTQSQSEPVTRKNFQCVKQQRNRE